MFLLSFTLVKRFDGILILTGKYSVDVIKYTLIIYTATIFPPPQTQCIPQQILFKASLLKSKTSKDWKILYYLLCRQFYSTGRPINLIKMLKYKYCFLFHYVVRGVDDDCWWHGLIKSTNLLAS